MGAKAKSRRSSDGPPALTVNKHNLIIITITNIAVIFVNIIIIISIIINLYVWSLAILIYHVYMGGC